MYPYLEPHGLIIGLNRRPLPELSGETVPPGSRVSDQPRSRHDRRLADRGNAGGVGRRICWRRPGFAGISPNFTGDRRFVQSTSASRSFSKWRCSIAGVYAWRAEHAAGAADRERMAREADFAFRQAWALCPDSPEAVYRYVGFLKNQKRLADARAGCGNVRPLSVVAGE